MSPYGEVNTGQVRQTLWVGLEPGHKGVSVWRVPLWNVGRGTLRRLQGGGGARPC